MHSARAQDAADTHGQQMSTPLLGTNGYMLVPGKMRYRLCGCTVRYGTAKSKQVGRSAQEQHPQRHPGGAWQPGVRSSRRFGRRFGCAAGKPASGAAREQIETTGSSPRAASGVVGQGLLAPAAALAVLVVPPAAASIGEGSLSEHSARNEH